MKRKFRTVFSILLSAFFLFTGCSEGADIQEEDVNVEVTTDYVEKEETTETSLVDNFELYQEYDDDNTVITMYLTVSSGNESDSSNHTWTEVNTYSAEYYNSLGVDRYKVEGVLQIDEGNGISEESFGYDESVPNVTVQVRGQTSSRSETKNYKIRIKDGKGSFRNQRTLNLNKHVGDPFRFTNKLCYEILEDIPQLLGGRTQFVNLYVKDTTEGGDGEYHDYGLYTMVEQVNKTYLKARGLDENGQLYKVTFFEWTQEPAIMIPSDDSEFDEKEFERYLEIKGDEDNTKLINVINEIDNYMRPIDEIVDEYFDDENLCYWMAFNILLGNYDSSARNLFLYSPLNSEKFYVICWDLDSSLRKGYNTLRGRSDGMSWERGASQFLGIKLVNRMMKEEKYRDMLTAAVEDLYCNYVTQERVSELAEQYSEITIPFLYGGADSDNARADRDEFDMYLEALNVEIIHNYEYYVASLEYPWPFFIGLPEIDEDKTYLSWDISYDTKARAITYDYVLARDYEFTDIVSEGHDLTVPSATTEKLNPGVYYMRVRAKNDDGYEQDCFDYYSAGGGNKIYACLAMEVMADGSIVAYTKKK